MNILVTGGAGYIGSVCVEELINQNHSVFIIDDIREGHHEAVLQNVIFFEEDFGNKQILRYIFNSTKIDVVIHFAAETTIEFSMTDPQRYFTNNVINSINLLDVMMEYNCKKLIFSSTAAIFGEPKYIPIDELHQQKPINTYGESKLMFEKVLDWYHKSYGFKFNIFRYFNAAGASKMFGEDHKNESHLIPIILNNISKPINVFGNDYNTLDGTCIRDYIHVVDLAKAHILALNNLDKNPNSKYNIGNGKGFSVIEVIEMVKKVTNLEKHYIFAPRRVGDPAVLVASSNKFKIDTGWKPKYCSLESIIQSAWDWHCLHPNGYNK